MILNIQNSKLLIDYCIIGEERFSALTASFFRGANAVAFVFDVTASVSLTFIINYYEQ